MTVESLPGEVWKPYPHDTRYWVSNMGRVRGAKGHLQSANVRKDGYVMVWVGTKSLLHRVVMDAFDPDGKGQVVCHNDGNKTNNKLSNLRRDTQKGNLLDRYDHGTMTIGDRSGLSVLTEREVIEIKKLLAEGVRQCDVMRKYKCSRNMVHCIAIGKTWSHCVVGD